MSSIYGILQVGRSALLAQQKGIAVTGENIANVSTEGYSRRRLNLTEGASVTTPNGSVSSGVVAKSVERVYDSFLGAQINQQEQELGRWQAQKDALDMAEVWFNEANGEGLSETLFEFWSAWDDLANDPSGYVERSSLLSKSENLADQLQSVYDALSPKPSPLDDEVGDAVNRINTLAAEIADFNQQIVKVEMSGSNANQQRDSRDQALEELSSLIDLNTFEQDDGSVTVKLGDGKSLVEGNTRHELTTLYNDDDHKDIAWAESAAASISDTISGGRLKGLLEIRDEILPGYMESLETLSETLKWQINALHSDGFGLDGSTGVDFFCGKSLKRQFRRQCQNRVGYGQDCRLPDLRRSSGR